MYYEAKKGLTILIMMLILLFVLAVIIKTYEIFNTGQAIKQWVLGIFA